MKRIRHLILTGLVAAALSFVPSSARAYCDPKYEGCTNDCKEMGKVLERFIAPGLFACPQ